MKNIKRIAQDFMCLETFSCIIHILLNLVVGGIHNFIMMLQYNLKN